ncbi:MAG TPA: glycine--tRNA ligase subunit beta [Burkholderiales bacterium]|nr:glycine--tRNA ligase subunit beta [Burkholderiales bacterium]
MQGALLIELLTEELPPKSLKALAGAFAERLLSLLKEDGLLGATSMAENFATPRRLAVLISHVLSEAPDKPVTLTGPPASAALDKAGQPTAALLGFAKKCGVTPDQLRLAEGEKGKVFVYDKISPGAKLSNVLDLQVADAIRKLPIPKLMRWGDRNTEFVRPVHGLIMLHGEAIVQGQVLGLTSGNVTRGHRVLGNAVVTIPRAQDYAEVLAKQGKVIAGFGERKELIRRGLGGACKQGYVDRDDSLLDEVTALVEYPQVYLGHFDAEFLNVPNECLMLSMKQHQKYFPVLATTTAPVRLLPYFLIVSNLETDDAKDIVKGNERVLRARLSDAKFFYDQDRKTKLADRVERLGNVVYHNKLGSQLERVQRIQKLAVAIAEKLHTDVRKAERAAWLSKADLSTDMVGEFPELQGTMGRYYAEHDGEDGLVARAIEEHYLPRISGGKLPEDNIGCAVALADKLDTLVGIYGIGLAPTGDKDPFGLRRQALGVVRILSEKSLPLDLVKLLELAKLSFASGVLHDSVAVDLHGFMLERLRSYLRERGFAQDEVEAVVSQNPSRIDQVVPRLEAVRVFRVMPEAESLASANKRIRNILKKTTVTQTVPDPSVLREAAEKDLFAATSRLTPTISSLWESRDYAGALRQLASVRKEVDAFFDQVMVMTDEQIIRNNRLALLSQLESLLNRVADISKLAS